MDRTNSFSQNYMLLKPEDINFVHLFRTLFSHSYYLQHHRKFVDRPATLSDLQKVSEEDEEDSDDVPIIENGLERRWIMFISIAVQKLLLWVATPMAWIGSNVEYCINMVYCNQGFRMLILNAIRGKLIWPNKESSNFLSFIGHLDCRVEFDCNIKPGDERYLPQLAMMASKASYENQSYLRVTVKDYWKMDFLGAYDFWNDYQEKWSTQGFLMRDNKTNTIVVAFRGTEPFNAHDWCSDFDLSWYELPGMGKLHGGFMKALGLQKTHGWPKEMKQSRSTEVAYYTIRDELKTLLNGDDRARYILTGHSLGGAVAVLFPAILALHGETTLLERLEGVYTFGQPRVGNVEFGQFMEKYMKEHRIQYFRFVYSNDMVPRLPYDNSTFMFKHFGTCYYYDSRYLRKILPEEPNKNYFSPMNSVPMLGNAIYELIRSFTIPSKLGPDYRENYIMTIMRLIGVLVPGLPAHLPTDYNNSVRLGSHVSNPLISGAMDKQKYL